VRRETAHRALTVQTAPGTPARVSGDAASLEQLFSNVLTNAVQASGEDGAVAVTLEADTGPQLVIRIRDQGSGMSPGVLARAGEPYFSTKPQGTGLGLAIARRIAQAHRGTIAFESANGLGTTVLIQLPRAPGRAG
jgi:signal transduction histidine kinase